MEHNCPQTSSLQPIYFLPCRSTSLVYISWISFRILFFYLFFMFFFPTQFGLDLNGDIMQPPQIPFYVLFVLCLFFYDFVGIYVRVWVSEWVSEWVWESECERVRVREWERERKRDIWIVTTKTFRLQRSLNCLSNSFQNVFLFLRLYSKTPSDYLHPRSFVNKKKEEKNSLTFTRSLIRHHFHLV